MMNDGDCLRPSAAILFIQQRNHSFAVGRSCLLVQSQFVLGLRSFSFLSGDLLSFGSGSGLQYYCNEFIDAEIPLFSMSMMGWFRIRVLEEFGLDGGRMF